MPTDLALQVRNMRLLDTHEHLAKEAEWVEGGPADVLQDLFTNYVPADLLAAGAPPDAVKRLADGTDPDLEARWAGVRDAWDAIQATGYGEAVRLLAKQVYGLDEIDAAAARAAQPRLD